MVVRTEFVPCAGAPASGGGSWIDQLRDFNEVHSSEPLTASTVLLSGCMLVLWPTWCGRLSSERYPRKYYHPRRKYCVVYVDCIVNDEDEKRRRRRRPKLTRRKSHLVVRMSPKRRTRRKRRRRRQEERVATILCAENQTKCTLFTIEEGSESQILRAKRSLHLHSLTDRPTDCSS